MTVLLHEPNESAMLYGIHVKVGVLMERTAKLPEIRDEVVSLAEKMGHLIGNGKPGLIADLTEEVRRLKTLHYELAAKFEAQHWFQRGAWKTVMLLLIGIGNLLQLAAHLWHH